MVVEERGRASGEEFPPALFALRVGDPEAELPPPEEGARTDMVRVRIAPPAASEARAPGPRAAGGRNFSAP